LYDFDKTLENNSLQISDVFATFSKPVSGEEQHLTTSCHSGTIKHDFLNTVLIWRDGGSTTKKYSKDAILWTYLQL
jgi:hypothetical protein